MTTTTRTHQAAIVARMRHVQQRYENRLAADLARFFTALARRVVARYLAGAQAGATILLRPVERKDETAIDILPPTEVAAQQQIIIAVLEDLMRQYGEMAAAAAGGEAFAVTDPRLQALLTEAGDRIVRIDAETRRAVQETLTEGSARGYSSYQIAEGVPADGFSGLRAVVTETYRGRARTIARTEIAEAAQAAAHDRYGAAGITEVDLYDGPECGLRNHHDPDRANGKRIVLAVARQYPIAHPNCRRVSMPVLETRRRA